MNLAEWPLTLLLLLIQSVVYKSWSEPYVVSKMQNLNQNCCNVQINMFISQIRIGDRALSDQVKDFFSFSLKGLHTFCRTSLCLEVDSPSACSPKGVPCNVGRRLTQVAEPRLFFTDPATSDSQELTLPLIFEIPPQS